MRSAEKRVGDVNAIGERGSWPTEHPVRMQPLESSCDTERALRWLRPLPYLGIDEKAPHWRDHRTLGNAARERPSDALGVLAPRNVAPSLLCGMRQKLVNALVNIKGKKPEAPAASESAPNGAVMKEAAAQTVTEKAAPETLAAPETPEADNASAAQEEGGKA